MLAIPKMVHISLRYDFADQELSRNIIEASYIFPVYRCDENNIPEIRKGDDPERRFYIIRSIVQKNEGRDINFASVIDPQLKICCTRDNVIMICDSVNQRFRRLEGATPIYLWNKEDDTNRCVIGRLEEMNIKL